jgi:hypothetical protein
MRGAFLLPQVSYQTAPLPVPRPAFPGIYFSFVTDSKKMLHYSFM